MNVSHEYSKLKKKNACKSLGHQQLQHLAPIQREGTCKYAHMYTSLHTQHTHNDACKHTNSAYKEGGWKESSDIELAEKLTAV